MNIQKIMSPFSELEARTKATEWEDRLLRANTLTVKKCPYANIRSTLGRVVGCFDDNKPLERSDFIEVAELMGENLQGQQICFDLIVRAFYDKANSVGFCTDGLQQQLEEAFLKGFDKSCRATGIPTTLETTS